MRRRFFFTIASLAAAAKLRAATVLHRSQLYAPPLALTADSLEVVRASTRTREFIDIGPSLQVASLTNPLRTELNVNWGAAPGFTRREIVTFNSEKEYKLGEASRGHHQLFCNGVLQSVETGDYTFVSNKVIATPNDALLDLKSFNVIYY